MFSFTIGTCLLLRQSEARFLRSAQTRHNFFYTDIDICGIRIFISYSEQIFSFEVFLRISSSFRAYGVYP